MAVKTTSTSATPKTRARRKYLVPTKPIYLTLEMREAQAGKEYRAFMDNITKAELEVIGKVLPYQFDYDPARLMKEFHRLLGISIAKCKVIPFPIERRLAAKEAQ
jgi:hypothetical protein